MNPKTR